MKNNQPTAIIGGFDLIARSFYTKIKLVNKKSIFINVQRKEIRGDRVFNFDIFQLKKILDTLSKYKIVNLLFLGKIDRPDLLNFKPDGEIEKYIPELVNSYKKGDGNILLSILKIFKKKGYNILSPRKISDSFFLKKNEMSDRILVNDKYDLKKSIKVLNDLSKYDNAQSIVCVNGYIIAIEAVEGTDDLLLRTAKMRKRLNQIDKKSGLLTKIPKKTQSRLVDLPVIGPKTLKLAKMANLNGIAINPKLTIVYNKTKFLKFARDNSLQIYDLK